MISTFEPQAKLYMYWSHLQRNFCWEFDENPWNALQSYSYFLFKRYVFKVIPVHVWAKTRKNGW